MVDVRRTPEQPLDELRALIGGGVVKEGAGLGDRRDLADHVEADPPQEFGIVGPGRGLDLGLRPRLGDPPVDRLDEGLDLPAASTGDGAGPSACTGGEGRPRGRHHAEHQDRASARIAAASSDQYRRLGAIPQWTKGPRCLAWIRSREAPARRLDVSWRTTVTPQIPDGHWPRGET